MQARAVLLTVLLLAAMVGRPSMAGAQGDDQERRHARARALWEEGSRRYDVGKFDEAIDLYLKAYEIWPFEPILFNLCQAHRQKSEYKKAVFYCKAYLRNLPKAENRSDVETIVIEMEQTLEHERATNEHPPEGVEHPIPRTLRGDSEPVPQVKDSGAGPRHRWVKWAAFGTGAAAVATGAYLMHIDGPRFDAQGRYEQEQWDTALPGVLTIGGGAALIATGVVVWILEARSHRKESRLTVSLRQTTETLSLVIGGRF